MNYCINTSGGPQLDFTCKVVPKTKYTYLTNLVHTDRISYYVITHAKSGMKIPGYNFKTRKSAEKQAQRLYKEIGDPLSRALAIVYEEIKDAMEPRIKSEELPTILHIETSSRQFG